MIQAEVVILRLATGEDIVGMVSETPTDYQIITPFKVIFRRLAKKSVGLTAVPWMPDELLDEHTIAIAKSQVVCIMHPKKEFVDYYHRVSDEFYMTIIDLDSAYRKQLMSLEKQERIFSTSTTNSFEDLLNEVAQRRHQAHEFEEDMYDEDEDDEPPTFH